VDNNRGYGGGRHAYIRGREEGGTTTPSSKTTTPSTTTVVAAAPLLRLQTAKPVLPLSSGSILY